MGFGSKAPIGQKVDTSDWEEIEVPDTPEDEAQYEKSR